MNREKIKAVNSKFLFINSVYHELWPPFVLLLLSIAFFFRLFYPDSKVFMIPDFGQSDVLHLNLPLKKILSDNLKNNTWPLWTPQIMAGFPLLAEGQIGTFYLPNLILFKYLPLVTAYNTSFIISFSLSSLGFYLLCRRLKMEKFASLFAALTFTFSGFFAVHLNHINLIQASSLLPLIFYSFIRLWNKFSIANLVFSSFLLSQQIFTGHYYIVFITFVGLFSIAVWSSIRKYSKLIPLASSLIFALLLSGIQLLPTFELLFSSTRNGGLNYTTITSYPYPFKHLITFVMPYFFGSPQNAGYPPPGLNWGIFWENTAYIGIFPLILAFFSLFLIRQKIVKILLILLLFSFLLVLGKNSPLYFIFLFPLFNFFRVPSKFLLLTVFSLSLLAGITLNYLFLK